MQWKTLNCILEKGLKTSKLQCNCRWWNMMDKNGTNIKFLNDVESYFDVYVNSFTKTCDYNKNELSMCWDDAFEALIRTSHVVKATNVAWGAGFCSFAARLMTAIGARRVISENIPGKGNNVHKLLSIASIKYLNEWKRRGSISEKALDEILDEIINQSIKELDDLLQVRDENDLKDIKDRARRMLKNLKAILPEALQRLGVTEGYDNLRFYTENEMIDYRTHIWGVPDLIIEHPRLRKAVVIEWKSDEGSVTEVEKYQAYIYAMLEAIRLGYGETFYDLREAIAPSNNVEDTKVLPIIIRPNYAYSDHPLFHVAGRNIEPIKIDELRKRIERIVTAATYLTFLIMDIDTLLYGSNKDYVEPTRERCRVSCNGKSYYLFRYTPSLLPRGNPMKQRDKYPCNACPFSDRNSRSRECTLYFGSYEKDRLEKLLWLYRFKVYRERDRDLMVYRALYQLADRIGGLSSFEELYSKYSGFIINLDGPEVAVAKAKATRYCGTIEISFRKLNVMKRARIGVYSIDTRYPVYEGLVLRRKLMPCENLSGEVPRVSLQGLEQPVLVTLIEDHVKYPTLGISLFGRVKKKLLPGERDEDIGVECGNDEVCVVVTPISPYLRLPFKIFNHYINEYGLNRALVVEADADLTNMDLTTLHALQMSSKNISKIESVEGTFTEAFNAYTRGDVS